jgi:bcr-type benzoyl-CoA reductase subunit B
MEQFNQLSEISSNERLRKLMIGYYMKAKFSWLTRKKIAWITSGGPVEPLISMGITPIYPENHGAMIGARKMGPELSDAAEDLGYSRDLCSYFRCDVGSAVLKKSPIDIRPKFLGGRAVFGGGLPKPDLLVCCNNICGTVLKWYEVQARFFNVPLIIVDTPYNYDGETTEIIDYVTAQFGEMITQIEKATGKRFSEKEFIRVGELSDEAVNLWNEVLSICENVPAPMTCFDAFMYLAPIVTLRGTQEVVDYYKLLKVELQSLADRKISPVPEEKFRLIWDNLPIWFKMRRLSKTLANYGAVLVADTYTNAWADNDIRVDKPIESMARVYATAYLNRNTETKINNMVNLMNRFKADGFLIHSNRSCKPYSFGQLDIKDEVSRRTGKPALMIEADMCDPRAYSDEQIATRIQAFIETLKERKATA